MQVVLPWPDSKLVPHAKGHWAPKARATKKARRNAYLEAVAQVGNKRHMIAAGRRPKVTVTLHQPDMRHRDKPNWEAACKPSLDGIADAIGVDDYFWEVTWRHGEVVPGGQVIVDMEVVE